jgi:glycerol-3-phosphate dehydrogenase
VFVVPWGDFTYIGTTDTDYDGSIDDPQCTPDDVEYLLRAINFSVSTTIRESDILGTWAGLRPLVRDAKSHRTSDLSRRHTVKASESGMVTVTGGKLTTYRRMAADTVDAIEHQLGKHARSHTKHLALHGADGWDRGAHPAHLVERYGNDAAAVVALADADPQLREPLVPGLPYWRAEAVYAARHEMACTVDDVLSRRTRARLLARDATADAADDVAALLGHELGWSAGEQQRQAADYRAAVERERATAALPETALEALLHRPSPAS